MTKSLREIGHAWRDTAAMSDDQLAENVRRDEIDILVDLAGHINNVRLPDFARRLAPVQATYLGYPDTTGLRTMDYRLTDGWHDPCGCAENGGCAEYGGCAESRGCAESIRSGEQLNSRSGNASDHAQRYYTERLVRLPRLCVAYDPGPDLPDVGPLLALSRGYVTFAAMNRLVKMTPRMIGLWSRILSAVPGSRLMVLAGHGFDDPGVRQRFERFGIDAARLQFVGWQATRRAYLQRFAEADLALDTFPYAGTTTSCDGLWMGVPTVTLAGETHVSRTGLSLMKAVGLPELVAATPERYVEIAAELARDLPWLAEMRSRLRASVECSPIGDSPGLTRAIESAFCRMIAGKSRPGPDTLI